MSGRAKADLGHRFFQRRRGGLPSDARSFTDKQRAGLLPQLHDGPVLAIFTSSPDELEINGDEWFTEAGRDPARFIRELREVLPAEYQMVVRMHPNQHGDRTGRSKAMMRQLRATPGIVAYRDHHDLPPWSIHELAQVVGGTVRS